MLSEFSYPIICTKNYVKTINFYEDFFDFVPEYELSEFVVLKRQNQEDSYIAILNCNHSSIPEEYRIPTKGLILNYPVKNVDAFYQELYWEGLDILTDPQVALCQRKHFFVKDPNDNLIDVSQNVNIEIDKIKEQIKFLCKEKV